MPSHAWQFDFGRYDRFWVARLVELIAYKRQHGHSRVPSGHRENRALSSWLRGQRRLRDSMPVQRRKILERLEVDWTPRESRWNGRYAQLCAFQEKYAKWLWNQYFTELVAFRQSRGHCNVPVRYAPSPKLGRWVTVQRSSQDSLPADCKRRLNDLGFNWTQRESAPDKEWDEWFGLLAAFKKRFGHCNVSYRWPENPHLGHWVCNQRHDLKSSTAPERKRKLDSLGFVWDPNAAEWEERFAELKEFHKRFGHCNASANSTDHAALGRWVNYQRTRATAMRPERKARLNRLGFVWRVGRGWHGKAFHYQG